MNDTDETPSFPVIPLAVAAVLGVGLLIDVLWLGRPEPEGATPTLPARLPPLAGEEARYAKEKIELGPVSLSRWQNFLGQEVTYVDGTVKNKGARAITALELTVEFRDIFGQLVLRETIRAVGQTARSGWPSPPLKPGDARAYRAGFEHLPTEWNRAAPRIAVTGLLLE